MKSTAVYAQPNLLRFVATRMCIVLSMQVQAVALGWFVYAQTGSALSLGLIGLAQFAPAIPLLTLAGYAADHYDRRKVVMLSQTMQAIGALGLYLCVHYLPTQTLPIYLMAMLIAGARSFSMPSTASLLPTIVTARAVSAGHRLLVLLDAVRVHGRPCGRRPCSTRSLRKRSSCC